MPTYKRNLTKAEEADYGARLKRLRELGIKVGEAWAPAAKSNGLILQAINQDCARIHPLPSDAVTVVVPIKMIVPRSGLLITDFVIALPWGDELDLDGIEESPSFEDVVRCYPFANPEILNRRIKTEFPLRPCQAEGLIIASGWTCFPPEYKDGSRVPVELVLWDERGNELSFTFQTAIDYGLNLMFERQRQKDRGRERPYQKTEGLFEPLPDYLVGCKTNVDRAQAIDRHIRMEREAAMQAQKSKARKPVSAEKPESPGKSSVLKREEDNSRSNGAPEAASGKARDAQ